MGVVATGVGLDFVLTDHTGTAERWILAGGLSVAMLSMAIILRVTRTRNDPRTNQKAVVRLVAIPIVLVVGALAGVLAMAVTTTILALVVVIEVVIDLVYEPERTGPTEH